jgi:hypothetical protein
MNIYVVAAGRRHIKIGVSRDVKRRIRGIQTGCPYTVRLVQSWNTSRAREIERKAHRLLAKYRWAGEWFDVPSRVAALAVGMLVASHPSHGSADRPAHKAIVFCRACGHSGVLPFIPDSEAQFRCTTCNKRDQVHVIDFLVSTLDSE